MKRQLSWSTDASGIVVGVSVHDSRLAKLSLAEEDSVELELGQISGGLIVIKLTSIADYTVSALWKGAIVSEIFAWRADNVPDYLWAVPDSGWNALLAERLTNEDAKIAAGKIALNHPNRWLMHISFSYGGNIAALCDDIAFFNIESDVPPRTAARI